MSDTNKGSPFYGPSAPWEPGQFDPFKHGDLVPADVWKQSPLPWEEQQRGNGHSDFIDAEGNFVVHVYFWDRSYVTSWNKMMDRIKEDQEKGEDE